MTGMIGKTRQYHTIGCSIVARHIYPVPEQSIVDGAEEGVYDVHTISAPEEYRYVIYIREPKNGTMRVYAEDRPRIISAVGHFLSTTGQSGKLKTVNVDIARLEK